jgi:pimeloyl-ACP methyl ester carboxylesterase
MIASSVKIHSTALPSFLQLPDGRRLAYRLTPGALPGVLFLGGFRSDMTGAKATAVEEFCRQEGRRCVRFDYTGHGLSSGNFMGGTIGAWKNDVLAILDHVATGANILIGSSMGGWLMLLATMERYEQVVGMIGIASAPDFTESLIWQPASKELKKELMEKGVIYAPSCNGEAPYPITRTLIQEAPQHLVLGRNIPLGMPIRLIHGTHDQDVPWQMSVKLLDHLKSPDISLELVKEGDHRLSFPAHLALLYRTLDEMIRITSRSGVDA